jgi:hypothetical protein
MTNLFATARAAADARPVRRRWTIAIWLGAGLLNLAATSPPPEWQKTIAPLARGNFPNPRQLVATYNFGWGGLTAATAEVRFGRTGGDLELQGTGQTIGLVRALWKLDVNHRAVADAHTLLPISVHQVEELRRKILRTDLAFEPGRVERIRTDSSSKKPATMKTFRFPAGLFDMHSALLTVRSQALKDGDRYQLVVYPATNAYLTTLTVLDHSTVTTPAGVFPAIKLDVHLKKVGKHGELEPHKKFRRARVWVSDDSDRLLLRIEASVFIGTVFAELQSIRFPGAKKSESGSNGQAPTPRDKPAAPDSSDAEGPG